MSTNIALNNRTNFPTAITKIPNQPGCYLFYDEEKEIIYIGKAQNLRKRISSYFPTSPPNFFREKIHSFNIIFVKWIIWVNV